MGCSHARTNFLISQNSVEGVFNGITERYDPNTVTIESEGKNFSENLLPIASVSYGRDRDGEYETGIDRGLKYFSNGFYAKGKIGGSYESRRFAEQKTHINLHIGLGMGIEKKIGRHSLIFGGVFNHHSNGNQFLKNLGVDVNNEPNRGINTLGYEAGFSF